MPRPGTDILIVDDAAPAGAILDTGQAFFVGTAAATAPTDSYSRIHSPKEYAAIYGDRTDGSLLSDAVSAYFAEGGGILYVAATADAAGLEAALGLFDAALGPGQVCAPGMTTTAAHTALAAHADATRRVALLDLPDDPLPATLQTAVEALEDLPGVRMCSAWAPWAVYRGPAGAEVDVPYSAVEAALIARSDLMTGNPNQPAAGVNGIAYNALGLSQSYTDEDRETLNAAGVCMAKPVYGQVRSYGYRTAAGPDDPNWLWFGNSRVVMAISHRAAAVAENYVLKQIDGRRQIFASLEAELRGICLDYFNAGALYGESPPEAFTVDTGPGINTIDTIKAGEVHAVIRLKCSPAAEWVVIEIVKVPVERSLVPAAA